MRIHHIFLCIISQVAELEYEYEPGISLGNLEFGQHPQQPPASSPSSVNLLERPRSAANAAYSLSSAADNFKHCFFCGVDYESGRTRIEWYKSWQRGNSSTRMYVVCVQSHLGRKCL